MKLKRIIYFGYYIKMLNKTLFMKFLKHAKDVTGKSTFSIWWDIFCHSLKYNTSILEYFQFGFYKPNCTEAEKEEWAGTGFMYEFQGHQSAPTVLMPVEHLGLCQVVGMEHIFLKQILRDSLP